MTSYRMARTLQSAGYLVTDGASGRYRLGPGAPGGDVSLRGLRRSGRDRPAVSRVPRRADGRVGHARRRSRWRGRLRGHARLAAAAPSGGRRRPRHRRHGQLARQDVRRVRCRTPKASASSTRCARAAHHPHDHGPAQLALDAATGARRSDVAFDIEERDIGTCAVAAPVRDQMGNVIAHAGRRRADRPLRPGGQRRLRGAVKAAAAEFSAFFGYAAGRRDHPLATLAHRGRPARDTTSHARRPIS